MLVSIANNIFGVWPDGIVSNDMESFLELNWVWVVWVRENVSIFTLRYLIIYNVIFLLHHFLDSNVNIIIYHHPLYCQTVTKFLFDSVLMIKKLRQLVLSYNAQKSNIWHEQNNIYIINKSLFAATFVNNIYIVFDIWIIVVIWKQNIFVDSDRIWTYILWYIHYWDQIWSCLEWEIT